MVVYDRDAVTEASVQRNEMRNVCTRNPNISCFGGKSLIDSRVNTGATNIGPGQYVIFSFREYASNRTNTNG
jgi:hypothetical protein